MNISLFMYGAGFVSGMFFLWAFAIAHDFIINHYRERIYKKKLEEEKKKLTGQ